MAEQITITVEEYEEYKKLRKYHRIFMTKKQGATFNIAPCAFIN